jgi:DNA-binding beta-propeller fold protein YncE
MRKLLIASCALVALAACSKPTASVSATAPASAAAPAATPIKVAGHTDLPGYTGDFDHFAVDEKDGRLFLAGEDGGALKVFDLKTGALIQSVPGFDAPHSLIYLPASGELVVIANDGSRVLDAKTLAVKRKLDVPIGADSVGWDEARGRLYVVTGGKDVKMTTSALVEIDPVTGKSFGETKFDGDHTEALAVEQSGDRIFINQTDKNLLDVVDKTTHAIKAKWKIAEAEQNAPIAMDEKTHRLFVVTRKPGKLLVVNADTGATVQAFDAPARVDQVLWDAGNRRIYVCGGDGHLAVFEQDDADHYRALPPVATPPASKTGIYVPGLNRLYLAASPGESKTLAQLVWLDVAPRQ